MGPELGAEDAVADDEVQLLEIGGGTRIEPGRVRFGRVVVLLQLAAHVVAQFALALQRQRHQFVPNRPLLRRFRVSVLIITNQLDYVHLTINYHHLFAFFIIILLNL